MNWIIRIGNPEYSHRYYNRLGGWTPDIFKAETFTDYSRAVTQSKTIYVETLTIEVIEQNQAILDEVMVS